LADADHAALRHVHHLNVDAWDVADAAQLVELHVGVDLPASGPVHDPFFKQGVVHTHDDTAGHLRFARQLVDEHPAVLDRVDVRDLDHAGFGIDRDLGDLAAADLARRHVGVIGLIREFLAPVAAALGLFHPELGTEFFPAPALALGRASHPLAGL